MADEIYSYTHPTDTAAGWALGNRVLALGEVGYDSTNNELRAGNGIDRWASLTPIAGDAGGTVDQTARDLAQSALSAAGAKYAKPSTGIPQSDLDSATSGKINAAGTAYQKPGTGIPDADLASTFIKTVNGNQPDSNGNIVVSGGGSGGAVTSVAGKTGDVTLNKSDVGLANVSNTSDANKPVSTAQATAIGAKYTKPSDGIPKTDLASDVQTSLGKADSAVQVNAVSTQSALVRTSGGALGGVGYSQSASNNSFAQRGPTGTLAAADPTDDTHLATKKYVDTALQSAPVTSVAGKTGAVTLNRADVGLSNAAELDPATGLLTPAALAALDAYNNKRTPQSNFLAWGVGALASFTPADVAATNKTVVAIGQNAMQNVTAVSKSIAIGINAMSKASIVYDDIAIGDAALKYVTAASPEYNQTAPQGTRNIGIGGNALHFVGLGYNNVAMGRNAGQCINAGNGLVAIGANSVGGQATIGLSGEIENWAPWGTDGTTVRTTAVGYYAAGSSLANNVVAIGGEALRKNKRSENNVAVGALALTSLDNGTGNNGGTTSTYNVSGTYSHSGTTVTITTASAHGLATNDIVGFRLTSGNSQTFQADTVFAYVASVPSSTSFTVTHPVSRTASGSALYLYRETAAQVPQNSGNTAVGYNVGGSLLTGTNNVLVGQEVLRQATDATQNTMLGYKAGDGASTATNSVALGFFAGYSMTAQDRVTAIGSNTLRNKVDGTSLTDNFSNITGIGYDARVSGSNQVQLGNTSQTVYTQNAIQTRSDARDKADIRDTVLGLDFIEALRPVDFKWDRREDYTQYDEDGNGVGLAERDGSHKGTRYHHGFIAQELQETIADSGVDFGGFQDHSVNGGDDVLSVGYEEMIAPMVRAIQELSAQVQALKSEVDDLRGN